MELKRRYRETITRKDNVLIVPSGIETTYGDFAAGEPLVLIVPSGIETHEKRRGAHGGKRINCT